MHDGSLHINGSQDASGYPKPDIPVGDAWSQMELMLDAEAVPPIKNVRPKRALYIRVGWWCLFLLLPAALAYYLFSVTPGAVEGKGVASTNAPSAGKDESIAAAQAKIITMQDSASLESTKSGVGPKKDSGHAGGPGSVPGMTVDNDTKKAALFNMKGTPTGQSSVQGNLFSVTPGAVEGKGVASTNAPSAGKDEGLAAAQAKIIIMQDRASLESTKGGVGPKKDSGHVGGPGSVPGMTVDNDTGTKGKKVALFNMKGAPTGQSSVHVGMHGLDTNANRPSTLKPLFAEKHKPGGHTLPAMTKSGVTEGGHQDAPIMGLPGQVTIAGANRKHMGGIGGNDPTKAVQSKQPAISHAVGPPIASASNKQLNRVTPYYRGPSLGRQNDPIGSIKGKQAGAMRAERYPTYLASRPPLEDTLASNAPRNVQRMDTLTVAHFNDGLLIIPNLKKDGIVMERNLAGPGLKDKVKGSNREPSMGKIHFGLEWAAIAPLRGTQYYFADTKGRNQPLALLIPSIWGAYKIDWNSDIRAGIRIYQTYPVQKFTLASSQATISPNDTSKATRTLNLVKTGGFSAILGYDRRFGKKFVAGVALQLNIQQKALLRDLLVRQLNGAVLSDSLATVDRSSTEWQYLKPMYIGARIELSYVFGRLLSAGVSATVPLSPLSTVSGTPNTVNAQFFLRLGFY